MTFPRDETIILARSATARPDPIRSRAALSSPSASRAKSPTPRRGCNTCGRAIMIPAAAACPRRARRRGCCQTRQACTGRSRGSATLPSERIRWGSVSGMTRRVSRRGARGPTRTARRASTIGRGRKMGPRPGWASAGRASRGRPARIALERPGRSGGRVWHYALSWQLGADGILLLREWGLLGTERPRRRMRRCANHRVCEMSIERCVKRLLRRGYRLI